MCVAIISGLQEAWIAKNKFNWKKALEFLNLYLKSDYFVGNLEDVGYSYVTKRHWVIRAFGNFISSGCRDENPAFDENNFELVENVFAGLLEKRYCEPPSENEIQEVINTSFGSIVEAYIMFSLRRARVNDKLDKKIDFRKRSF